MQAPYSVPTRLASPSRRRRSPISLTPLIDVVFILLVFFLLASTFLDWRSLSLDTSAASAATPSRDAVFVIRVGSEELRLNGELIELAELIEQARVRQPAGHVVSVQPVGETRVQQVIKVLDALNAASIQPLRLVEDPLWPGESGRDD